LTNRESNAATVEFDHITKHYGAAWSKNGNPGVVNDLSLTVPAGKICVLVGPSGCGKTTSLKMVNRLIEPTTGRILLGGVDAAATDLIGLRRNIGYVIQQVGLFPHQTVEENVGTVPRLLGWEQKRRADRAAELLHLVGLDPGQYARRFPSQLSGGERQRVGVARALAADPPIMLMDEPFGAVDPIVRERLQNEFLRLQEDLAKTILFVTHDIDEAIKMGDLVAVFELGGRVAQYGTPAEILAHPASDFVAQFVGSDRGLKRLSLYRVGDIPPESLPSANVGSSAPAARSRLESHPFEYLLVLDESNRPLGWATHSALKNSEWVSADLAQPMSPLLDRRTTLKDALSQLLEADVQAGLVVDRNGTYQGVITVDTIAAWAREKSINPLPTESFGPGAH
jgi:osmoprotectant transport system ATP-binding protein